MRVAVYTSFTFSYLGKARVLAESLKKFHPDWDMVALLTDKVPDNFSFDVEKEFFDYVIWGEDLDIPNVSEWISEHNIVEACTAVKGPTLEKLATSGKYDYVMYLDPDVAVFSSLQPLIEMFSDEVEVLLTPHQLSQEEHDDHIAIIDNELSSTKHGVYNLGFVCIASKGAGLKFANWWSERLKKYCRDDIPNGMFTDQKWCDLVPAYFDNVKIVRDPGYNVASWNISQRKIEFDDLVINLKTYEAKVDDQLLDLTFMEYELLKFFVENQENVWSREELLEKVWGYDYFGGARTVDVHVRRLRSKLGEKRSDWIKTVHSVGYKFN